MKKLRNENRPANLKLRYNLATTFVYCIGIILLLQLFNLQIVHGGKYRTESNTRLTRETKLEAARGNITDRTGNVIVSTKTGYGLELYKSKIDTETLNQTLLEVTKVLEANGDSYVDSFPILINPYQFNFDNEEKEKKWKQANKLDENLSAEQCFIKFKEKYKVSNENIEEARKIITLRYRTVQDGYSNTKSVRLADDISNSSVNQFGERNAEFPGISVVVEPVRNYEKENLASHIIGYTGKISDKELETRKDRYDANDEIGKAGVEYVFEDYLKGESGTKQIDMAVDGTVTGEYVSKEAIAGSDVVLTIDANLQAIAEEALENNIHKIASGGFSHSYDTNSGAVVAINVKNGEILAMASYPDYNPQIFVKGISSEDWKSVNTKDTPLINKAVQGSYAPGSTFKMITAIAGLESENVTLKEKINDTGIYSINNQSWKCWYYTDYHRGHGWLNVSDAIKHSCNYYFYETAYRMGIDTLVKYEKYFGLGTKTGIELPSETAGTVASKQTKEARKENWYQGDTLNAAIGQGDNAFSPIQMARYISILVNGGNRINPTIVKTIRKADGTEVSKDSIYRDVKEKLGLGSDEVEKLDIKQENLDAVLEGMRSVTTESGGTAYSIFKDFNIEVGGKTGSAEAGKKVNAWFVGFAPFDEPEIAVVVMVENGGHGNYTAEVARDIIAEYFGMNAEEVKEDMTASPYIESIH